MANRTRVALIDMRPRMRQIVADAVADEPDLEIVTVDSGEVDARVEHLAVDVFIVGTENPDDVAKPKRLLAALPHCRVLMVATSGRRAAIYELRPEKLDLGEVSAGGIVRAIKRCDTGLWQSLKESRSP